MNLSSLSSCFRVKFPLFRNEQRVKKRNRQKGLYSYPINHLKSSEAEQISSAGQDDGIQWRGQSIVQKSFRMDSSTAGLNLCMSSIIERETFRYQRTSLKQGTWNAKENLKLGLLICRHSSRKCLTLVYRSRWRWILFSLLWESLPQMIHWGSTKSEEPSRLTIL